MPYTALPTIVGRGLRAVFAALTRVRHPRPIHPRGVHLEGEAVWLGASQSGVRWIDDAPGSPVRVTARSSRSIGVPAPLPDVVGLALRFEPEGAPVADLELASTGVGVPGRFLLLLRRSPSRAHLSTLLPYVGEEGAILLAARTVGPADLPVALTALAARLRSEPWRLRLYVARPRGPWHPFAEVTLRSAPGEIDTPVRFDAGRRLLPGAWMPGWVRAVRQPSYDLVQRSSDRGGAPARQGRRGD